METSERSEAWLFIARAARLMKLFPSATNATFEKNGIERRGPGWALVFDPNDQSSNHSHCNCNHVLSTLTVIQKLTAQRQPTQDMVLQIIHRSTAW